MERPFVNDVEVFISKFIHSIDGKLVTEYINYTPDFENADYFLEEKNIVIELKCLEKDLFSEEDLERNERLIDKWLQEKIITKADIIAIFLRKKQIPEKCLQEMFQLARRTLQKIIEKANKQLRETKKKIGNNETQKILMVCNDGNYLFNHNIIFPLICDIIASRNDIDINSTIYFTVNQSSLLPNSNLDWSVWMTAYSDDSRESLYLDVNELGRKFNAFYNDTFNIQNKEYKEYPHTIEGIKAISELKFIPKEIIYGSNK